MQTINFRQHGLLDATAARVAPKVTLQWGEFFLVDGRVYIRE